MPYKWWGSLGSIPKLTHDIGVARGVDLGHEEKTADRSEKGMARACKKSAARNSVVRYWSRH